MQAPLLAIFVRQDSPPPIAHFTPEEFIMMNSACIPHHGFSANSLHFLFHWWSWSYANLWAKCAYRGVLPPPCHLRHTRGVLRSTAISALEFVEDSPPAPMADILRCHDYSYVKRVQEACALLDKGQLGGLDGDTVISEGSFQAARYAAGAVLRAVDAVVLGEASQPALLLPACSAPMSLHNAPPPRF